MKGRPGVVERDGVCSGGDAAARVVGIERVPACTALQLPAVQSLFVHTKPLMSPGGAIYMRDRREKLAWRRRAVRAFYHCRPGRGACRREHTINDYAHTTNLLNHVALNIGGGDDPRTGTKCRRSSGRRRASATARRRCS